MTLHSEIMNIHCEPIEGTESEVLAFKLGHKQARNAAEQISKLEAMTFSAEDV